jgi:hypothetical protein
MRNFILRGVFAATLLLFVGAPPANAQVHKITSAIIDAFLKGRTAEKAETESVAPKVQELDQKIDEFRRCKADMDAAGSTAGSHLGGLAGRLLTKKKCGATSEDGWVKDKDKLMEDPQSAASKASGMKWNDYQGLKNRLVGFLSGDTSFDKDELDVLNARKGDLGGALAGEYTAAAPSGPSMGGSGPATRGLGGMMGVGAWTAEIAWGYIEQMFAYEYFSGAAMLEQPYKEGEWTRWRIAESDQPDQSSEIERAFIGTTADGNEIWRHRLIENDGSKSDTLTIEGLFKPMGDNDSKQLVRARGKFPGDSAAQELIVPQQFAYLNMAAAMPFKPTKESIDGATVGTEDVKTGSGTTVSAKHVRFGGMGNGGSMNWWLSDSVPGGVVRFEMQDADKTSWTMELMGSGTGATSELGIK